jgi:hypothetical protein
VQIASAETNRHRLSRYGDQRLNSAIHTVAMIQIRMPAAPAAPTTRHEDRGGTTTHPDRRRGTGLPTPW